MCLRCPNARRSTVHLPRLSIARDQVLELLATASHAGPVPPLRQQALTGYLAELNHLITELTPPKDHR